MNQAEDIGEHVQDRLSTGERLLVVVAGPNGAGKSTFVDTFLRPTGLRVVNPDQIARALAPDDASAEEGGESDIPNCRPGGRRLRLYTLTIS